VILFLYGTLLDPRVLVRVTGERRLTRRLRPARLVGYARVALRGTPYPTLIGCAGAHTNGALLRVGGTALARLMAYEGAAYRLCPVRVLTAQGPCRAWAWIAPRWRAAGSSR
jgi:gamma-glutamylcyclotransferase (GGCT)/AIG2-like uncharacterized protein YtfP